jgi:hypothetical protein
MQQNPNEIICVVDRIEDDEWQGKPYKRLIAKSGEDYKIGQRLNEKWVLLKPGAAVRLIMDVFKGNTYVKDFDLCYDLTMDKMAELSQPSPKNPKDLSIEKQTAVKCVSRILAGGQPLPDDIKELAFEWLRSALK